MKPNPDHDQQMQNLGITIIFPPHVQMHMEMGKGVLKFHEVGNATTWQPRLFIHGWSLGFWGTLREQRFGH